MQEPRFIAIEFGRPKDNYIVFLKTDAIESYDETLRIFENAVIQAIQNSLFKSKNQLSDFDLVHFGIQGLLKNGYQFFNLCIQPYRENQEIFCGEITILDETDFKTLSSNDEKENICAVYIFSGIYQDQYEIKLFKSLGDKNKFVSDCNKFHPVADLVQNVGRVDFIEKISDYLKLNGYNPIDDCEILQFSCHSSDISDYWEEIIGAELYKEIKETEDLRKESRLIQEPSAKFIDNLPKDQLPF